MKKFIYLIAFCAQFFSCGQKVVPAKTVKLMSAEDGAVIELLTGIKKNPADKSLLELLPSTYQRAMDSRMAMKGYVLRDNPPGDRWVYWRKQLEASQSITDAVLSIPQASAVINNPVHFRDQISDARQQAAEEYYQLGMELLRKENRRDARTAIDQFRKANREVANFRDVAQQIRFAEEKATLYVVVNSVDYYSFGFSYWGFQNDYLQWQMIQDLNRRSFNYTRFITDRDAYTMRLRPERVVDMRFARLFVYNPYTEQQTFTREKTISTPDPRGDTARNPANRGVQTVRATVIVTKRLVNGDADLECRIYDTEKGRNILYDNFPGRYNWVFESATYTGDSRALTESDRRLINNRFDRYPTREEVGQKLIRDAYGALIRRIEQGVNFDVW